MFDTKYLDVAEELESRIDKGHWRQKLPPVTTLSRELGVNPRTLAKALRSLSDKGRVNIRPSTGAFIRDTRPVSRTNKVIGVLGMLRDTKKTDELVAIEEQAAESGYYVLNVEHCRKLFRHKPNVLLELPVDGLIFTNSVLTPEIAQSLNRNQVPFVAVNRVSDPPDIHWVDYDHQKAHQQILTHLLDLGHRRMAYVAFRPRLEEHDLRIRQAHREVLEPLGLLDSFTYVADGDMAEYDTRYGEYGQHIYGMEKAAHLMRLNPRPTAVIICGQEAAHGFCTQAKSMALTIPADVSVVAEGNRQHKMETEAFLTMIGGGVGLKAKRAVDILLKVINSPNIPPVQQLIDMDVVIRRSTGPSPDKERGQVNPPSSSLGSSSNR